MATAPSDPRHAPAPVAASRQQLKVSAYDRASSLLLSLLVLVGGGVLLLFLMWLMTQRQLPRPQATIALEAESGGGAGEGGEEQGFEEPNAREVQDLTDPPFEQTLASIQPTVGQNLADLEMITASGAGGGGYRDRGPGGLGSADVVPRWLRWVIHYASASPREYARQLDFFGVELAAVSPESADIEYVGQLSAVQPTRRSGPAADERRLYMRWQTGPLQNADRQLLQKAGVAVDGRTILQYYSDEIAQQLARLEAAYADGKPLEQIRKTVFGVRPNNGRYEYYVLEQQLRLGAAARATP